MAETGVQNPASPKIQDPGEGNSTADATENIDTVQADLRRTGAGDNSGLDDTGATSATTSIGTGVPVQSQAILALRTREDFRFKVNTVKWFGGLCAIALIGMIGLGFWYLDRMVEASQAYKSEMDFSKILSTSPVNNDTVLLGLEHDGLGMRNKRAISALYMRAYTQFLALIAGTVLSLLGAVFVLARVDSVATTSDATIGGMKWALSSSSPGIIVSIVGAVLIGGVVYLASDAIQVFDAPVFLGRGAQAASPPDGTFDSPDFQESMKQSLKRLQEGDRHHD